MTLLAQAGQANMPLWAVVLLVLLGIGELLAVASYFASHRELQDVKERQNRMEDLAPPGEVRAEAADKYVTKAECAHLHALTEQKLMSVDTLRVEDARAFSASRGKIYDEVKSMRMSVSDELVKVRAEMVDMERRLGRDDEDRSTKLHDRLNEILSDLGEMRGELKKK